jgi:hypothetical protein
MAGSVGGLRLPTRLARTDAPIPRRERLGSRHPVVDGDLIPSEESATFWLWAWPQLLGWPRAITWLFSPVVGHLKYPGDLWGLDSQGNLLIVETKLQRRGHEPQDPFSQFVGYCRSAYARRLWRTESLKKHLKRLEAQEQSFVRDHAEKLTPDCPLTGSYPGILPYSSHRATVWYWQTVFRLEIAPRLSDSRYERAVDRCLRLRETNGNPPPIFFGLVATTRPNDPRLSAQGFEAFARLRERVGGTRAHLRAIRPQWCDRDRIEVRCWTPDGPAAAR